MTKRRAWPTLAELDADIARRSLSDFTKQMWHVIKPDEPLIWNWHMDAICEHVQALLMGTLGKQNLLINVPPGSAKSTILSVAAPAWMWLHKPSFSFICASGNETVATRDSMKCRDVLNSRWYRQSFNPKWYFSRDQNAKTYYKNSVQGVRRSTTTNAAVIGERADALLIDDPIDATDAYSTAVLEQVRVWYYDAFRNRLNNPATSVRCLIMQRLAERDLSGWWLTVNPDEVCHLVIPAKWDEKMRKVTSLGWTDPRKEEGENFFPTRYPERVLNEEKLALGERGFEGQYQQRPYAAQGNIFRRGYVQFICPANIPKQTIKQTAISWDTSHKKGADNDYCVSLVGVEFDRGILISERIRRKMTYPELKEATKTQAARVRASVLLIEDKASGQDVITDLQVSTSLPVRAVQVNHDKIARAWATVPTWEAQRIFLPCNEQGIPEEWCDEFLNEMYSFPTGAYDDQVDAFTQLVYHFVLAPGARGILAYYAQQIAGDQKATAALAKEESAHHVIEYIKLLGAK